MCSLILVYQYLVDEKYIACLNIFRGNYIMVHFCVYYFIQDILNIVIGF